VRVRIKICGLTRPEDARCASGLGVDAIGLNFYPPSPRFLGVPAACAVRASIPAFVTSVAVFVNPGAEEVRRVIGEVGVDMLQFHGTEPARFCEGFGLPYLKAIGMHEGVDLAAAVREYPSAAAWLLDVHDTQKWGGTGRSFDWSAVRGRFGRPIVLAGGLAPENVQDAIRRVRPFAVDVCGGVESAGGIKDEARLAAFVERVEGVGTDQSE
jgi:phosphoribosylanthranilate isomerase